MIFLPGQTLFRNSSREKDPSDVSHSGRGAALAALPSILGLHAKLIHSSKSGPCLTFPGTVPPTAPSQANPTSFCMDSTSRCVLIIYLNPVHPVTPSGHTKIHPGISNA